VGVPMTGDARASGTWSWEDTIAWLRTQPDHAELILSGYYDDPLEAAALRYWRSEEWQAILSLLPTPIAGKAMDLGAGRGITSYALAKAGYRVVAVEADPGALVGAGAIRTLALETGLPIEVQLNSSGPLPFPSETFELVFGRAVLHHLTNLEQACEEMARVLKPGGTAIFVREHVISHPRDLEVFRALHPLHRYYGGENAHMLERYTGALERAGLRVSKVISPWRSPINFYPRTVAELRQELARRLALGSDGLARAICRIISVPGVWHALLRAMEAIDNRPGRLYSFVALRP
jgi:SAM-dependent methyltransferase